MNRIFLSIGSNAAERDQNVMKCMDWIAGHFTALAKSDIYTTPAINGKDNDYTNSVMEIESELEHDDLKAQFKQHEKDCGRIPESKALGIVPIDIDIVTWNDEILKPSDYSREYFQKGWRQITSK